MRKRLVIFAGAIAILALLGQGPLSADWRKRETSDFTDVARAAEDMASRLGRPESVLVAVDIDNTLLKSEASLGSDQWYSWQDDLLKRSKVEPPSSYLAAGDAEGLLRAQGILFDLGSMIPPDPRTPGIIRQLEERGFKVLVVTGRGPEFRDATFRELRRNGYEFLTGAPGAGRPGVFKLRPNDRPVSYSDGVFLTSGQDKGRMLSDFMDQVASGSKFKGIIFVDDSPAKVDQVGAAFEGKPVEVLTLRYGREDSVVSDFNRNRDGVQDLVKSQWEKLKTFISEVWGWAPHPKPQEQAIR